MAGATTLTMEFDTAGTTGNAWTLAASANSNATRSAATLIGGGYQHLFTAGGATPSKTLEVGHTQLATPSYRRFLGVNLNDFSFSLAPRGVASARINAVAQQRTLAAASLDATPTAYVVTRFSQGNGLIKVGGTQLAYVTAGEFSFTNSPDVVETIRADGLIDGVDMGRRSRPAR